MRWLKSVLHIDNFLSILILLVFYGLFFRSCNNNFTDPIADAFADVELTDIVYAQFNMNDKYSQVTNGELTTPDTNIVIVNIGNLNREGIAKQIHILNKYKPKVLGVDVIFADPKDDISDFALAESLANVKDLVLTTRGINYDWSTNMFDSIQQSYSLFSQFGTAGYANLITKSKSNTENLISSIKGVTISEGAEPDEDKFKVCRRFLPTAVNNTNNTQVNAFAVQVCQRYNPVIVNKLLARQNQVEYINYLGNVNYYQKKPRFRVIDVQDVLNNTFDTTWVKDKIVLLGFIGGSLDDKSSEDNFYTPLNPQYIGKASPDMHGVVVHANIISMMLEQVYINEMPLWLGHVIGFLLTYLTFAVFRGIYNDAKVWYDGLTKIVSLIVMGFLIFLICLIFYKFNYKVSIPLGYYVVILISGDYLEIYYSFIKNIFFLAKRKLF